MKDVGRRLRVTPAIVMAATALLVTACGSTTAGGGPNSGEGSRGAAVTLAVISLPTVADIDPRSESQSVLSQNVGDNIAGTLFGYDGSTVDPDAAARFPAPRPELATSATPSRNGLTWTFQLRPHVLSQDGNPLTAADVVFTVKRALHTAASGANLLEGIHIDRADPATATGPLTVEIHLSSPSSLVVKTFSVSYLGILDEKALAAHSPASDPWGYGYLRSHSAGFGPYEVSVDELPNKEVITANPHYFGGRPQITRATFTEISDDSTRLEAALSGQVDYGASLSVGDLARIRGSATVKPDLQHASLQFYLLYVMKNPLVASPLVRRALSLAVDRRQITKIAYQGAAQPITSCVAPALYSAPPSLADANPAAGDLAEAKRLYTAGHGPRSISLGFSTLLPGGQALAEVVQSDLKSLGVTTNLLPFTSYTTFVADQAAGKFPVALEGFGPNVVDPGYVMYTLMDHNSNYDLGGYDNGTLNEALGRAETLIGTGRTAALASACRLALSQAPIAPLVTVDDVGAASRRISELSSLGGIPLLDNMRTS